MATSEVVIKLNQDQYLSHKHWKYYSKKELCYIVFFSVAEKDKLYTHAQKKPIQLQPCCLRATAGISV